MPLSPDAVGRRRPFVFSRKRLSSALFDYEGKKCSDTGTIVCTGKKSFRLKKTLFLGISPIVYAHGVRDQTVKGNGGFPKKRPPRTHPPPPHRRSPYSAFEQRDWSGDGPPVRPPLFYRMVCTSQQRPTASAHRPGKGGSALLGPVGTYKTTTI